MGMACAESGENIGVISGWCPKYIGNILNAADVEVTSLRFDSDGIGFGVGTSTGLVRLGFNHERKKYQL